MIFKELLEMWADFEDLYDIPVVLAEKAVHGLREEIENRPLEEIRKWRDEKLLELMQVRSLI